MVETIDVDLVAKGVAALVAALEQRIFVRLHIVIAVKVGVGADADLVDADALCDMVDMVGHMPDVGGIGCPHEHTQIGRASCREKVGTYGKITVGAVPLQKNKHKTV